MKNKLNIFKIRNDVFRIMLKAFLLGKNETIMKTNFLKKIRAKGIKILNFFKNYSCWLAGCLLVEFLSGVGICIYIFKIFQLLPLITDDETWILRRFLCLS